MKFLLFSVSILVVACATPYKSLKLVEADQACIDNKRPQRLNTTLFSASVDVIGKHMSGLLLIKEMPDQSMRIVFTSETGLTFFDFAFTAGGFEVKSMIPQLRKKAVVNTLRKDFEALLALPFENKDIKAWSLLGERYFGTMVGGKERAFFVVDSECSALKRVEVGTIKPLFSIITTGQEPRSPESVVITHHTFNMVITLKKIERHVAE